MTQAQPDNDHMDGLLAHLLYKAEGGVLGTSSGSSIDPMGADTVNRATQKSSGSTSAGVTTTGDTVDISAPTAGSSGTSSPVEGGNAPVSQPYGVGNGHESSHPGIDLSVPLDTRLLAAQDGRVTVASNADPGGYGLYVEIETADGHHIRYGHMHGTTVNVGDRVRAGQVIGTSGGERGGANSGNSTGAHLHFEVRGPDGNTVDPTPWLAGGGQIVGAAPSEITTTTTTAIDPYAAQGANLMDIARGNHPTDSGETKTTSETKQVVKGQAGSAADGDESGVEAFLSATRQHESGGNYQIRNQSGLSNAAGAYQFIGSTWRGLGGSTASAADASPAEQDRIARAYALQLFRQFHSWRLVAIAWYGGPGIAQQVAAGSDPGAPDQQGGYLAYGDTIAGMMARGEGA